MLLSKFTSLVIYIVLAEVIDIFLLDQYEMKSCRCRTRPTFDIMIHNVEKAYCITLLAMDVDPEGEKVGRGFALLLTPQKRRFYAIICTKQETIAIERGSMEFTR